MKALTSLAKFTGTYKSWQQTREDYNLKWSSGDSLQVFYNMMDEKTTFENMIGWVRNTIKLIPEAYYNIIIFNVLTGLRPSEACASISLIQNNLDNYLNKGTSMLEHFRFPEFFIRRTKKAYVSIANDLILDIAKKAHQKASYNAVKLFLSRRDLDTNVNYCRKVFATHLRNQGINQEIIDLLQGRIDKSVFVRHYYKPDLFDTRLRDSIESLYKVITE